MKSYILVKYLIYLVEMRSTVNFRAKRARLVKQRTKIRQKAEAEKGKRIIAAKAKEAADKIKRKRNKIVTQAKKNLKLFEESLTKLESDHVALARFRADRHTQLKEKIAKAERDLNALFRLHDRPALAGENRPKRVPRKEYLLEEKLRAFKLELKLIDDLR